MSSSFSSYLIDCYNNLKSMSLLQHSYDMIIIQIYNSYMRFALLPSYHFIFISKHIHMSQCYDYYFSSNFSGNFIIISKTILSSMNVDCAEYFFILTTISKYILSFWNRSWCKWTSQFFFSTDLIVKFTPQTTLFPHYWDNKYLFG